MYALYQMKQEAPTELLKKLVTLLVTVFNFACVMQKWKM